MYSYTDTQGNEVFVTEEHLETAVAIKLQLQNASPSRRASWKQHEILMEKEGFTDSSSSESYRLLIKRYQGKIGQLPSAKKHADMVASKKLESIQELVGDIAFEKRDNQNVLRELNKAKRQIIDGNLYTKAIAEGVERALVEVDWEALSNTHSTSPITVKDGSIALALISDWHIGALVETKHNTFNYEVAKSRVKQYVEALKLHCKVNGIKHIEVVFMGDLLEGAFMRAGQGYEVEFSTAEQIVKASEMVIDMLMDLSSEHVVRYRAFSGNHDRMNQMDKGNNIHGDSAVVLSNEIVKTFIRSIKNPNLSFVETEHYSAVVSANGVNVKLVHGDLEKKNDVRKIHDHSSRDGINYDIIAYGHFHHFQVLEVGLERFELRVGSIKGVDHYAEKFGLGSSPSQAIVTIGSAGEIDIKRVSLK